MARAKITSEGLFLERLETDPARFLPEAADDELSSEVVAVDLDRPMGEILARLTRHPVKTRLALTGTLVVGRDIVHAKISADSGGSLAFNRGRRGPLPMA